MKEELAKRYPEIDCQKEKYPNLNNDLITGVQELVGNEIEKSRNYGLLLDDDFFERESGYFLKRLNDLSSAKTFHEFEWNEFILAIRDPMHEHFEDEISNFHDQFRKNKKDLRMYDYHLELTMMAVVRLIDENFGLL